GTQLDLDATVERGSLDPRDRLVEIADLPDPVARDELLGFGERAVDDGPRGTLEADTFAFGRWREALAREHDARAHELIVETAHRAGKLGGGQAPSLRAPAGRHKDHHSHGWSPFLSALVERCLRFAARCSRREGGRGPTPSQLVGLLVGFCRSGPTPCR